jgi:hypothetical protein
MTREEAINALKLIQRREARMQEYKLQYPATWHLPDLSGCSDDQLMDIIAVDLGLPLGTVFTDEQMERYNRSIASLGVTTS